MKFIITLSALAGLATAFPRMVNDPEIMARAVAAQEAVYARHALHNNPLVEAAMNVPKKKRDEAWELAKRDNPLGLSKAETNCGPTPCLIFDPKDQLVSVTGQYAYASPAVSDIRGPCPGLNAAANHGYLPRNGIASIEQTIAGLGALYNMSPELALALAAYAVAIDGNVLEGVWSIGGPLPEDPLTKGLFGTGQGLSYSHNNYEGDSSIGRNDAYTNKGDAHSLNITKFEKVYAVGGKEDRYTLDKFRQRFEKVQDESIANNPYYFTGAFSTVVVVPAAYNFVINFMSNHSAAEPSGYLDGYNFKKFFGVVGKPGSFKWIRGQERVPKDWYRRPSSNQYNGPDVFEDVGLGYQAYPKTLKFGGNLGKVNTFTGVNIANFTGGVFDAKNLFDGDNFGCFAFALLEQGVPDFVKPIVGALSLVTDFIEKAFAPIVSKLDCPELGTFDQGLFNNYPGRTYKPKGKDTNYKH